jgi:prepilin-type N-terminal cleavage/methylation domain-containing protein
MKARTLKKRHFSLIELLVVISIIGILTAIILPALSGSKKAAEKTKNASRVRQIAMAVELYYSDYQTLPSDDDFTALTSTGNPRGKNYYNGPDESTDGATIYIKTDGDYDNEVTAQTGETVNGVVAVSTTYDGDPVISWEKN